MSPFDTNQSILFIHFIVSGRFHPVRYDEYTALGISNAQRMRTLSFTCYLMLSMWRY